MDSGWYIKRDIDMGMDPDTDQYMLTGTDRGIDTDMDMNIYIHMHNDTDNDIVWNYVLSVGGSILYVQSSEMGSRLVFCTRTFSNGKCKLFCFRPKMDVFIFFATI